MLLQREVSGEGAKASCVAIEAKSGFSPRRLLLQGLHMDYKYIQGIKKGANYLNHNLNDGLEKWTPNSSTQRIWFCDFRLLLNFS